MSVWRVSLLLISAYAAHCLDYGATPYLDVDNFKHVAKIGDARERGPRWYDYRTDSESNSKIKSQYSQSSSLISSGSTSAESSRSSGASSIDTDEKKTRNQAYRHCTKCPNDMLKKHKNIGIKWICAGYQRARRTFKSPCMMRYRNCQDGTLFIKLYDHRCKNSTQNGRHWFYQYRV